MSMGYLIVTTNSPHVVQKLHTQRLLPYPELMEAAPYIFLRFDHWRGILVLHSPSLP